MKGRILLIDAPKDRASQVALIVDGRLQDLLIDPPKGDTTPAPGEIYWAKLDRLTPKMGGAFVRLTPEHTGFLRDSKGLREGAGVLVQVTGYAEPGKAPPVTGRILYKGRWVIHTPEAPGTNVSRQIRDDAERARLIETVGQRAARKDEHSNTEIGGFIVRTAASGVPATELAREVAATLAARQICEAARSDTPPASRALHSEPAFIVALREWTADLPDRLVVAKSHYRLMRIDEVSDNGPTPGLIAASSSDVRDVAEPFDGPAVGRLDEHRADPRHGHC